MPTREVLASFWRDWDRLTPQQQRAFRDALVQFIADIAARRGYAASSSDIRPPGSRAERFDLSPVGSIA
jgi:hypothetical protein